MTSSDLNVAKELVKAHCAKWQVLNRSQWNYKFRGKVMVRYVDAVRMREDELKLVLEYLTMPDCISTLSLMDQSVGSEWKPIRAWLEVSNKGVGNVGGIRLYHGLQTDPISLADGPYLVDDGCAYKVSIEYHWSESEPPPSPPKTSSGVVSSSGVIVKVSNLNRDPESGRYSYAIEVHERVQQDIKEYLTSTTVFNDTFLESHIGVKEDNVESTGKKASVGGGEIVSRQISKNSDCTKDVANRTVVEKKVEGASESVHVGLTGTVKTTSNRNMPSKASADGLKVGESVENSETEGGLWNQTIRKVVREASKWLGRSCRKTFFGESHTEHNVQGSDPGFSHVKSASGGVVEEKRVSVTSDGSYDVSSHKTIEKTVEGASESVSVGLTGTSVVTHNRNMPDRANTQGLDVGESVENSRTEGGLWNQTIRKRIVSALLKVAESCRITVSSHSHSSSVIRGSNPGFTHVSSAAGGRVSQKSVSRTSDGSYRVEERDEIEIPVSEATVRISKGLHGIQKTVRDIHQSSIPKYPDKAGESVEYSVTPGGLHDITKVTRSGSGGVLGVEKSETFYTKSSGKTKNVDKDNADDPDVLFSVGQVVRKSVSRNGDGTANEHETVTTAKPSIQRYDWVNDDIHHYVVKYRNQKTEFAGVRVPEKTSSVSKSDSINDFGLHDGVISWTKGGRWKTTIGDKKFVKHGKPIVFFFVKRNKRTRRLYHNRVQVQLVHIQGDAYTDYLSDKMDQNPKRQNSGVVATRLLRGPYTDKDGNELAAWEKIVCSVASGNAWTPCTKSCEGVHPDSPQSYDWDFGPVIRELFGDGRSDAGVSSSGEGGSSQIATAINSLPEALSVIMLGQTYNDRKKVVNGK